MKRNSVNWGCFIAFISFFACKSNVQENYNLTYSNIVIKVISPTDCRYIISFSNDSLIVKSINYSYNSNIKTNDTIYSVINYLLNNQDKEYLQRFVESPFVKESKIENQTTQDLYKYELLIQDKVIKKAICCDSPILNLIQQVVLPNVHKSGLECNSFFEIIKEMEDNKSTEE